MAGLGNLSGKTNTGRVAPEGCLTGIFVNIHHLLPAIISSRLDSDPSTGDTVASM